MSEHRFTFSMEDPIENSPIYALVNREMKYLISFLNDALNIAENAGVNLLDMKIVFAHNPQVMGLIIDKGCSKYAASCRLKEHEYHFFLEYDSKLISSPDPSVILRELKAHFPPIIDMEKVKRDLEEALYE